MSSDQKKLNRDELRDRLNTQIATLDGLVEKLHVYADDDESEKSMSALLTKEMAKITNDLDLILDRYNLGDV